MDTNASAILPLRIYHRGDSGPKKQSRASGTAGMKLEPICKRHVIGPEFRTIALAADC